MSQSQAINPEAKNHLPQVSKGLQGRLVIALLTLSLTEPLSPEPPGRWTTRHCADAAGTKQGQRFLLKVLSCLYMSNVTVETICPFIVRSAHL